VPIGDSIGDSIAEDVAIAVAGAKYAEYVGGYPGGVYCVPESVVDFRANTGGEACVVCVGVCCSSWVARRGLLDASLCWRTDVEDSVETVVEARCWKEREEVERRRLWNEDLGEMVGEGDAITLAMLCTITDL
jgi:hypothetical protein